MEYSYVPILRGCCTSMNEVVCLLGSGTRKKRKPYHLEKPGDQHIALVFLLGEAVRNRIETRLAHHRHEVVRPALGRREVRVSDTQVLFQG